MPTQPLPTTRPSRVIVEPVRPVVDGGAFAAKASLGEPVTVLADVFTNGHEVVRAVLRWRAVRGKKASAWRELAMTPLGNDRFTASFTPDALGRVEYDVVGWLDHLETWRRAIVKKIDAGLDVTLEAQSGAELIGLAASGQPKPGKHDRGTLDELAAQLATGDTHGLDDDRLDDLFARTSMREPTASFERPLAIVVDPLHGSFGAWYEFFPRSSVRTGDTGADPQGGAHGDGTSVADGPGRTLLDSIDRLDHVAGMGFDVVYLPPVHPIGTTKRKGRNNSTTAEPGDVGSPWAIGGPTGGHTAVAPELGTVDDVSAFASACRERGMQLALDIAFQCSPDHPWVTEHPEWFAKRADGSIQFAENPPKKYEDIYPLDFESADWKHLWKALADVFRFWIEHGVTTFRVDNPHTKAFAFWEWAIATLRDEHPEVVFLAESFTRPRVMERLAKLGFNQNYTYFAWRQSSWELTEYFTDLSTRTVDWFRPNAWPNTPDILTEQLQTGGRPAFVTRAILAATLSPSWGVYGPAFELLEHRPVHEGSEEYLDSEKYQLRTWDLDRPDSLAPLLTRLNRIRSTHRAFRHLDTLHVHETDHPGLFCYSRRDRTGGSNPIVCVVNLDPDQRITGFVDVDLQAIGLPYGSTYDVHDLLGGARYTWHGNLNYVDLAPWSASAHIFEVDLGDTDGLDSTVDDTGQDGKDDTP
jgi:starch synthase (maltosyl-transferring)